MTIGSKIETLLWFVERPSHWRHALELAIRKVRPNRDGSVERGLSRKWASQQAVATSIALEMTGIAVDGGEEIPRISSDLLDEGHRRTQYSGVAMGGAGDIDLLYAATLLSGASRVVETGVAYGWSSLAILAALNNRPDARLISVDMPYPKMGNEEFVGVVVPEQLRNQWTLIRMPDRNGLQKAISSLGGTIDLCHYDSDKEYWGRVYGYRLMWEALRGGGVFISDDIQDNFAFKEFVEAKRLNYAVTEFGGKYVGICMKPF